MDRRAANAHDSPSHRTWSLNPCVASLRIRRRTHANLESDPMVWRSLAHEVRTAGICILQGHTTRKTGSQTQSSTYVSRMGDGVDETLASAGGVAPQPRVRPRPTGISRNRDNAALGLARTTTCVGAATGSEPLTHRTAKQMPLQRGNGRAKIGDDHHSGRSSRARPPCPGRLAGMRNALGYGG